MGCGTLTVKIASILINVILAIFALIAIVYTAINLDNIHEDATVSLYIVCALIIIFAFLGCYAAIRESICLTATCATFLLLLAVLQIAAAIVFAYYEPDTRNGIATVERAWQNNAMDSIQIEHKCCGKVSAQDYVLVSKYIPASCYPDQAKQSTLPETFYLEGCSAKLQNFYDSERVWFIVVSSALITFEIVGFLLAVFLVINFRNKQRRLQF